jgi:predicted Zn-dependent peptidase
MSKEFHTHVLPNGLRVIFAPMERAVTHCALMVQAGTRDEVAGEWGLAHFIEHALFKGTDNRKAFHILNRMESVGGEINAFTSKEDTWITSSQRNKDTERAIELLSDIAFHSTFPALELDKEREVILDEISGLKEQPGEWIFEAFESHLFHDHPLSRSILGTSESVQELTGQQAKEFVQTHYQPQNMVLGVVGAVSWKQVLEWTERWMGVPCSHVPPKQASGDRTSPDALPPFHLSETKGIHQSHFMWGTRAPGAKDSDRLAMTMVANLLGGPAMNCRLNLNIRERHGMVYHIEANHVLYEDAGVFNVYCGTDAKHQAKVDRLVRKELAVMRTKALGVRQLHEAKQQILGQIALGHDHGGTVLSGLVKAYAVHKHVETLDTLVKAIESMTSSDLLGVSNRWLQEDAMSSLTFTTPEG